MASKFSDTPWYVQGHSRQGYSQVIDAGGDVVAICLGPDHETNSHLFATAPELYAEVKTIVTIDGKKRRNARVEALLKKAEGK